MQGWLPALHACTFQVFRRSPALPYIHPESVTRALHPPVPARAWGPGVHRPLRPLHPRCGAAAHSKLAHLVAQQLWVSLVGPVLLKPLLEQDVSVDPLLGACACAGACGRRATPPCNAVLHAARQPARGCMLLGAAQLPERQVVVVVYRRRVHAGPFGAGQAR